MEDQQYAASKIAAGILGWDKEPLPAAGRCRVYDDLVAMAKEMLRRNSVRRSGARIAFNAMESPTWDGNAFAVQYQGISSPTL
jgi:hypothetical protein